MKRAAPTGAGRRSRASRSRGSASPRPARTFARTSCKETLAASGLVPTLLQRDLGRRRPSNDPPAKRPRPSRTSLRTSCKETSAASDLHLHLLQSLPGRLRPPSAPFAKPPRSSPTSLCTSCKASSARSELALSPLHEPSGPDRPPVDPLTAPFWSVSIRSGAPTAPFWSSPSTPSRRFPLFSRVFELAPLLPYPSSTRGAASRRVPFREVNPA